MNGEDTKTEPMKTENCKVCNASGEVEDNGPKPCPKCGGNGFIILESELEKAADIWYQSHYNDPFGVSPQDVFIAGANYAVSAERERIKNELHGVDLLFLYDFAKCGIYHNYGNDEAKEKIKTLQANISKLTNLIDSL